MFLHPLGLLALTAVPAVVALHLYRRRFRPRVVSAVFLWHARDHVPTAGRKREPLRTSPSFWCEVLAALALALAFAGPRGCGAGEARHLVVVLDGSASMGAVEAGEASIDRARAVIEEHLAALPSGARATLVLSGPRPEVIAGPAAFLAEAREALEAVDPGRSRHDLEPAIALGLQLAGGGEVLAVTDHFQPGRVPAAVELVAVGRPLANLALTAASRRAGEEEGVDEIHVELSSFGGGPSRGELVLGAGGVTLGRAPFRLEPGERRHMALTVPSEAGVVAVRLPGDALAVDDAAYLAPPPRRSLRLAVHMPLELARGLGLASAGSEVADAWAALVHDARAVADPSAAHVVIATDAPPPGDAWCLVLDAPAGAERRALIGPFLIDKRHPLLAGLTLEGTVWSAAAGATPPGAPLVVAGDEPLLAEAAEGGRALFTANIDPARSSLVRSPDWPILLANLAELRRAALPGPARTSLVVGEPLEFRAADPAQYRLIGPDGTRQLRARDLLVVDDVTTPGEYVLERLEADGARELCRVGWTFADPAESNLRAAGEGRRAPEATGSSAVQAGHTWVEVTLLALALLFVALDWLFLDRARRRYA